MAITSKTQLKQWFVTAAKPNQAQFHNWLDSYWHKEESIAISNISGLSEILGQKADSTVLQYYAKVDGSNIDVPTWQELLGFGTGGIELGETSTTAYRGDRGKEAYDHANSEHNTITGKQDTGDYPYHWASISTVGGKGVYSSETQNAPGEVNMTGLPLGADKLYPFSDLSPWDYVQKEHLDNVTVDLTGYATELWVTLQLSSVYKTKPSVDTFEDLPTAGNTLGDARNVRDTGKNYVWVDADGTGAFWDDIGGLQDISGKQDISDRVTSWSGTVSNSKYPSEKLVKDSLDNKIDKVYGVVGKKYAVINTDGSLSAAAPTSGNLAKVIGQDALGEPKVAETKELSAIYLGNTPLTTSELNAFGTKNVEAPLLNRVYTIVGAEWKIIEVQDIE